MKKSPRVLAAELLDLLEDSGKPNWSHLAIAVSDLSGVSPSDVEKVLRAHGKIINGPHDPDCELANYFDNLDPDAANSEISET